MRRVGLVLAGFVFIVIPIVLSLLGITEEQIITWALITYVFGMLLVLPMWVVWEIRQHRRATQYIIGMLSLPPLPRNGSIGDIIELHRHRRPS